MADNKNYSSLTEEEKEKRREAVRKYQKEGADRVNCLFPKGTKERIKNTGMSCNQFIKETVLNKLDEIEKYNNIRKN